MRLLIADDLTGACDSGIAFAKRGISTDVLFSSSDFGAEHAASSMLAINTGTRNQTASRATARLTALCEKISGCAHPELIFKKVDSTLRGQIAAETCAIMGAFDLEMAFIAPAAPLMGRTVVNGQLLLDGVPIDQTPFGQDPLAPVKSADLGRMFAQTGQAAGIGIAVIENGPDDLLKVVRALRSQGARYLIFDCTKPAHLETIAQAGLKLCPNPLFVGSGGLAAAVASLFPQAAPEKSKKVSRAVFFVCGSAHNATHSQIERLAAAGVPVFHMPEDFRSPAWRGEMIRDLRNALSRGSAALAAPVKRFADPLEAAEVSHTLARLAVEILSSNLSAQPGLFLTGGETAYDALSLLGKAMCLRFELEPGVALAELLDGPCQGMPVTTKAGGFGSPDTLVNVMRYFSKNDVERKQ